MRFLLTIALALSTLFVSPAARAQVSSPTRPVDVDVYLTSRAVLDDYLVCTAQVGFLEYALEDVELVVRSADAALSSSRAEVEALRQALSGAELALDACDGRRAVTVAAADELRAQLDRELARRRRAERSRGRWRSLALAGPVVVGAAGVVAGVLLAR